MKIFITLSPGCRETGLPLHALSQVLREVHSGRMKPTTSHTHTHKSNAGIGGGRHVEEHCSHRQMTSEDDPINLGNFRSLSLSAAGTSSPVKEAHTGQKTISLVTTPPFTQPLPPSAAREHTSIAQLTFALLAPRFNTQVLDLRMTSLLAIATNSNFYRNVQCSWRL